MKNNGSISSSRAASFHRPHPIRPLPEDDDKLSLYGVTFRPDHFGRERMVTLLFRVCKNSITARQKRNKLLKVKTFQ